ncbi:MAG: LacI family DNA-binding transcriptional regulator [Clostridia bacterium]|nr:LacI family DNA-binding transcriptional regulator [Clostridia bacterium]
MTMRELARLANVSVSTVSKAFSDAEDISSDTKNHIFKVAREYGCYHKFYKGKFPKSIIAVIAPEINSAHYSTYIEFLQRIIESSGGIMLLSAYQFDSEKQIELIEYYSDYLHVDGIIVFSMREGLKKIYETPIVSLYSSKDQNVEGISLHTAPAFKKAIKLLKDLGHKHIAFASESLTLSKAKTFCEYYMPKNEEDYVFFSNNRFEKAGIDCAEQILNSKIPFTAIFCAYDDIAFGVIKHLTEKGYNVPRDFSVIGIDNISVSSYLEISLTTIDPLYEKSCNAAWELLQKKMKNKYYKSKEPIEFTAELIVRDSVAKAK